MRSQTGSAAFNRGSLKRRLTTRQCGVKQSRLSGANADGGKVAKGSYVMDCTDTCGAV